MRRTCTVCGVEKRLGDFYWHPRGKDGHESLCKLCRRKAVEEQRAVKGEIYREQQRLRYATDPEYRERKRASWRAWIKTPQGRESRRLTQRAARAFKRAAERSAEA